MSDSSGADRAEMAGQTSDELLALFDTAQLNARYWAIFVIMSAIIVLVTP